eukprot:CAMPEP_0179210760 /NCGR_PEP_ID=MMETSP0796-20121207/105122_1 /TAXON_ID=73915 /ORGANISM="Pyrodinium bahamense, Strain pbaha01" /LENGTH=214 /DNA_ID=CAMNT_0020915733 /DNA_START=369 /DNA_END=1011 /DNA_ORIENTATION=+
MPRGRGERHARAVPEDAGLHFIRHCWVHDGAVPEAAHPLLEAVHGIPPTHGGHLRARGLPAREALEVRTETIGLSLADEVDEGVAKVELEAEVDGQVHEVVAPAEALCVQQVQHAVAREAVREIPQHDRGLGVVVALLLFIAAAACVACLPARPRAGKGGPSGRVSFSAAGTADGSGTLMSPPCAASSCTGVALCHMPGTMNGSGMLMSPLAAA